MRFGRSLIVCEREGRPMSSRNYGQVLRASASASVLIAAMVPWLATAGGGLPGGGRYVSGSGKFGHSGNRLVIDQRSMRGIIDWQSFSVGSGQTVQINNGFGTTF